MDFRLETWTSVPKTGYSICISKKPSPLAATNSTLHIQMRDSKTDSLREFDMDIEVADPESVRQSGLICYSRLADRLQQHANIDQRQIRRIKRTVDEALERAHTAEQELGTISREEGTIQVWLPSGSRHYVPAAALLKMPLFQRALSSGYQESQGKIINLGEIFTTDKACVAVLEFLEKGSTDRIDNSNILEVLNFAMAYEQPEYQPNLLFSYLSNKVVDNPITQRCFQQLKAIPAETLDVASAINIVLFAYERNQYAMASHFISLIERKHVTLADVDPTLHGQYKAVCEQLQQWNPYESDSDLIAYLDFTGKLPLNKLPLDLIDSSNVLTILNDAVVQQPPHFLFSFSDCSGFQQPVYSPVAERCLQVLKTMHNERLDRSEAMDVVAFAHRHHLYALAKTFIELIQQGLWTSTEIPQTKQSAYEQIRQEVQALPGNRDLKVRDEFLPFGTPATPYEELMQGVLSDRPITFSERHLLYLAREEGSVPELEFEELFFVSNSAVEACKHFFDTGQTNLVNKENCLGVLALAFGIESITLYREGFGQPGQLVFGPLTQHCVEFAKRMNPESGLSSFNLLWYAASIAEIGTPPLNLRFCLENAIRNGLLNIFSNESTASEEYKQVVRKILLKCITSQKAGMQLRLGITWLIYFIQSNARGREIAAASYAPEAQLIIAREALRAAPHVKEVGIDLSDFEMREFDEATAGFPCKIREVHCWGSNELERCSLREASKVGFHSCAKLEELIVPEHTEVLLEECPNCRIIRVPS